MEMTTHPVTVSYVLWTKRGANSRPNRGASAKVGPRSQKQNTHILQTTNPANNETRSQRRSLSLVTDISAATLTQVADA